VQASPTQLFHAYDPLKLRLAEEASKSHPDKSLMEDIAAALEFLDDEFAGTFQKLNSLLQHGDITYDLLWVLFPPKSIIYTENNLLREPQAMQFGTGSYKETQQGRYFEIEAKMIHHDGEDFGWSEPTVSVPAFEGAKKVNSLSVYPLDHHKEYEKIRELLLARGRTYLSLLEPICKEYDGLAIYSVPEMGREQEKRFLGSGRIMIDPIAFRAQNSNSDLLTPWVPTTIAKKLLTDDDLILCNYRILGFSFQQKRWGSFAISRISEVVWNESAVEKLILEDKKRRMISSLVLSHRADDEAFDDIVKGKGKGLVGLLSGPPGVGKTLTAEVMAELSKRPLYIVSAGELGTDVDRVDEQFGMVLDITRRWGCVLLIDEADVFLYRRGEAQLQRNALVSVFLRRIE
jgi:hypothetical protein